MLILEGIREGEGGRKEYKGTSKARARSWEGKERHKKGANVFLIRQLGLWSFSR
jgi:hypothetical protein